MFQLLPQSANGVSLRLFTKNMSIPELEDPGTDAESAWTKQSFRSKRFETRGIFQAMRGAANGQSATRDH